MKIQKIIILDLGISNVGSLVNILKKIGYSSEIRTSLNANDTVDKIILPGVGSFDEGVKSLKSLNLIDPLNELVLNKKKLILGICLGMQLFCKKSQEGQQPGLSWVDASVQKFNVHEKYPLTHMGWNTLTPTNPCEITDNLLSDSRFYFVHSYYIQCDNGRCQSRHSVIFDSVIQKDNIYGVQFHPEKSHKYGMHLLKNFCEL